MGLIDHFWDDTVAGPRPDPITTSFSSLRVAAGILPVTRSITILRPPLLRSDSGSGSEPQSPLTPSTPTGDWRTPRREQAAEPRSPTVYDWMVISALDR